MITQAKATGVALYNGMLVTPQNLAAFLALWSALEARGLPSPFASDPTIEGVRSILEPAGAGKVVALSAKTRSEAKQWVKPYEHAVTCLQAMHGWWIERPEEERSEGLTFLHQMSRLQKGDPQAMVKWTAFEALKIIVAFKTGAPLPVKRVAKEVPA